jgi:hypothetical protein
VARSALLRLAVGGACLASLGAAGCPWGGPRARAEAAALRRQTDELRRLLAAADKGEVLPSRCIAVGVRQDLVRDLVELTLPVEATVAGQLVFRLERAEVAFQGGESRVTLRGRVRRATDAGAFADLTVTGGIHGVKVAGRSGYLSARVALDRLEVHRAAEEWVEGLVEKVGGTALTSLAEEIPPLEIPVRFEKTLVLAASTVGPVSIAAAELALRVDVAQVVALDGRLWVLLDVSAEPQDARARKGT